MNAVEAVARALAHVGPGEDWPQTGASWGTGDDEYKWAMEQDAKRVLGALVEWLRERNDNEDKRVRLGFEMAVQDLELGT